MVRLAVLPEEAIISALKGTIDFYEWKGIAVARAWPIHPPRTPHEEEAANQGLLTYIMQLSKQLPSVITNAYKQMASTTPLRWQDLLVRGYISGFGL